MLFSFFLFSNKVSIEGTINLHGKLCLMFVDVCFGLYLCRE